TAFDAEGRDRLRPFQHPKGYGGVGGGVGLHLSLLSAARATAHYSSQRPLPQVKRQKRSSAIRSNSDFVGSNRSPVSARQISPSSISEGSSSIARGPGTEPMWRKAISTSKGISSSSPVSGSSRKRVYGSNISASVDSYRGQSVRGILGMAGRGGQPLSLSLQKIFCKKLEGLKRGP